MAGHSPTGCVEGVAVSDNQSVDTVFDVLAHQRRRYVLAYLTEGERSIALADLAEDIAVRENDGMLAEIPKETIQAISTSLHHRHLPKLVDAEFIEYEDHDLIRVLVPTEPIERLLSSDAVRSETR